MSKNILLLFLSDVKTRSVDGKVVISEAAYENVAGEKTQTTNESAVRYLSERFLVDKIFVFASKKVRKKIADRNGLLFLAADGKPRSHLKFSLERGKKFLTNTAFKIFPYNEDGSGEENLKSVAKMARVIQDYVGDEKDVLLHVDLTGGLRHFNMMMLELTRLLEYSGLKVEKVLYSNYNNQTGTGRVEEIKNVYDLFQLIAGVEEFVNFGSVKALKDYYKGKKISEPLNRLLDAMKIFADAIKLCHYSQFNAAIIALHDAVKDFKPTNDVEDVLMATFIARIRKDYADLIFPREKDDLRVIRWCLDNDYLQQALILYTERIPEYLDEHGIIVLEAEKAEDLKRRAAKAGLKPFFYLFSKAEPEKTKIQNFNKGKEFFCKAVKHDAWPAIRAKAFNFDAWLAALNQKLEPLNLHCPDDEDFRAQFETLAEIFKDPKLLLDLQSPALESVRKILNARADDLKAQQYGGQRVKVLKDFFNNTLTDDAVADYFTGSGFMKYPKALKMYALLDEGAFGVKDRDKFLSIADKYFRIKGERNYSAHAREDYGEFKTAADLCKFMYCALDEIATALPAQ